MDLKPLPLANHNSPKELEKVTQEAYKWGKHRGDCSAQGDRYGTLGGPKYDDVLKDYLREKFGIHTDLESISLALTSLHPSVLGHLRKGFDEGYAASSKAMSKENSDEEPFPPPFPPW